MWIGDVDLPSGLVEAHRAGKLVLFVGAGASLDAPAKLPDFRTLAKRIAAEAHVPVTKADLKYPDRLLGLLLTDQGVAVHRRVATHIGTSSSRPNATHEAIVALAASGPPVRIVTTNYDPHLSTVLADRGLAVREYLAPALPMGDDFEGVVYLHGCVREEPRHLVVTDADFGRAYLRDAWAARFLERMFAEYTVLFVGYSHSDVVMTYLARGLRSGTNRYVLTADPDAPNWRRLGVHPVGYEVVGRSHAALPVALRGWASSASMGLLDHRQRMRQLALAPPSQVPEEMSYLEWLVSDEDAVRLFAEFARSEEWLAWVASRPEFRQLFDPAAAPSPCGHTLAYWFAEHYVMQENRTAAALRVVRDAGGRLGPQLWSAIGHEFHRPRPVWLGPWLVLLLDNAPAGKLDWIDYALIASRWPDDRAAALLLFDFLADPQPAMQPSFGGPPTFDIELRGSESRLRHAWQSQFAPHLAHAAADLLPIVDRHLRKAHSLLTVAGSAHPGQDSVSFRRSAIEPHDQDQMHDPVDVLINAARDCLEFLLDNGDAQAIRYLDAWADSDVPILRRLAVHGWTRRTDIDATRKIDWLRERRWLADHQLHHEVYELIGNSVGHADRAVADALVADLVASFDDVENETHRAYERFNALTWVTQHAPDLPSARDALDQITTEHPDFEARPYPDLSHWMDSGIVGPQPPMTTAELHEKIAADPSAAVAELRTYEGTRSPFKGPGWDDAILVLTSTVKDHPADGFAVLDADGGDIPDIASAVIRGWAGAALDDTTADRALTRLADLDLSAVATGIASMLADGGRDEAHPTEWQRFPAARQLASKIWRALDSGPTGVDGQDWLGKAINHPAGNLAQFWLHALAADWRAAKDTWTGLAQETRSALETMLAGDDTRGSMAQVILASQLRFLHGAAREWCEAHVLPLLDWADQDKARRAWDGFLTWGRPSDALLNAGLLDHYFATVRRAGDLSDGLRRQLANHLAAIALSTTLDPLPWIKKFTATADLQDRVEWMNEVDWMLTDLPADAVEQQWQRWMRPYWTERLDSIPIPLSLDEATAMAPWVLELTESIEEGVALATAHEAALDPHGDVLHDLDSERLDRAPTALARLVAHLLRSTKRPFWGCPDLANVVGRLRAAEPDIDITPIAEEATRLGCDAMTW